MLSKIKKTFIDLFNDEKGAVISTETLILIVGTAIVASIVVGVMAVIMTGTNHDGKGGVTKEVSNSIENIIQDITNDLSK